MLLKIYESIFEFSLVVPDYARLAQLF